MLFFCSWVSGLRPLAAPALCAFWFSSWSPSIAAPLACSVIVQLRHSPEARNLTLYGSAYLPTGLLWFPVFLILHFAHAAFCFGWTFGAPWIIVGWIPQSTGDAWPRSLTPFLKPIRSSRSMIVISGGGPQLGKRANGPPLRPTAWSLAPFGLFAPIVWGGGVHSGQRANSYSKHMHRCDRTLDTLGALLPDLARVSRPARFDLLSLAGPVASIPGPRVLGLRSINSRDPYL